MKHTKVKIRYHISLIILIIIYSLPALCQSKSALNQLIDKINTRHDQLPVEKLYLQTDKAGYVQNDTLWFKAYLFSGDYLTPSALSGLLYLELDDENNKCAKRIMVPLLSGLSWGNITLDADEIPEGTYTLRSYTNWMRNFGEDYVFKKQIYVTSAGALSHFVATDFKETKLAEKNNIQAALSFSHLNGQPLRLQDMQLRVTDGKHTLFRENTMTDIDGKIGFNFPLPKNTGTKNLLITAKETSKDKEAASYNIPVSINLPENTDLQFMPEGGALVAGIASRIGFKAIGEDGKGIDVSGKIYNSRQQEAASFKSTHKGMGSFEFTPQAGESYTAKLTLPDGSLKSYPLPGVSLSGISLRINDRGANDSLHVTISASPDQLAPGEYYLLGLARNIACYGAHLILKGEPMTVAVPKNAFPTGIAHFTLLNNANLPVAERLIYVDQHDRLRISIKANQNSYAPHDSIALNIQVNDKTGRPVSGSFSVAVTDDSQVKTDSMGSNIINNILLTSDLKGTVEDPAYYFEDSTPNRLSDLDNLLLTQGWVGYNWKLVFNTATNPAFEAEQEFAIKGKITTFGNKPIAGTAVTLLSKKPFLFTDTVTDKDGRFTFQGFSPVDTASFFIQAKNKRGKSVNVLVDVDEFKAPVFTQTGSRVTPWYVNSDTLLLHSIDNHIQQQHADENLQGFGHVLKEVKISDKKIVKGSKNLNGPGKADQIFDEQDIIKAGKMTLGELLEKKVKGFAEGYISHSLALKYVITGEEVNFVFDGMYLNRFYMPSPGDLNGLHRYIKQYLDYYTVDDISGIEVMYNPGYSSKYVAEFLSPMQIGDPIAFIEVTTRSGHGPFMTKTPGTYLYRPLPITLPKQFYRPKYAVKSAVKGTDLRSTIHWEPFVITDSTGKATVSFYSADKPATYSITIEGTNLTGEIGFKRGKLLVH